MSIACVIIASEKRRTLIREKVLPSALRHLGGEEVYVVGDFEPGLGYTYLPVPPITGTTIDALVKRDVGTLATNADGIFYLSDDHMLRDMGVMPRDRLTIGVPDRRCGDRYGLNMGLQDGYCGGHAGLFPRELVQRRPWSTMPHHRLWDMLSSHIYVEMGATLEQLPYWTIEDVEPNGRPWL